jgi:hypothetical protein
VVQRVLGTADLAEQVAVALAGEQLHPVERLQQRTDGVATQVGDAIELACPRQRGHGHQAHHAGRQQTARTAGVERGRRHLAGGIVLGQQQRGDEIPRQREEHRHTQVSTGHPADAAMEQQHDGDRESAGAVERWLIGDRLTTHRLRW